MNKKKKNEKSKLIMVICVVVVISVSVVFIMKLGNNQYQNNAVPANNSVCSIGDYLENGECKVCPAGSYCNNDKMYSCPPGTGSFESAVSELNCTRCSKGFYSEGNGGGCKACPYDTTTEGTGSTSIKDCK